MNPFGRQASSINSDRYRFNKESTERKEMLSKNDSDSLLNQSTSKQSLNPVKVPKIPMPSELPVLKNLGGNNKDKPSMINEGESKLNSQQSIDSYANFSTRNSISSRMLASERMRSNYSETKLRKPMFGADMSFGNLGNNLAVSSKKKLKEAKL